MTLAAADAPPPAAVPESVDASGLPAAPRAEAGRAWPEWVDLAALAIVFVVLTITTWGGWPDVLVDFGRELYVAWRVSQGNVLYRDVASFYGPLSPYVNAAWFRLLGVSLRSLVLANLAILIATTLLLRALLRRAGASRPTAAAAAAVFLVVFGFGHLVSNGSFNFVCPYSHEATHGFALALGALLCALRLLDTPRWPWAAASGLLSGLAFLTKPEPFVAGLGASALAVMLSTLQGRGRRLSLLTSFAGGLLAPPLLGFLLLAGAMPADEAWRGTLGSWAYVGIPEVRGMQYFLWSAGLDHPLQHLDVMARASALQLAVLVPTLGLAWALRGQPRAARWAALACAGVTLAALAPSWSSRGWLRASRPLPFWSAGILAAGAVSLRQARRREDFAAAAARTALAVFALLLLLRVILNARLFHYGFVLTAPAALLMVAALLDWIPRALQARGAAGGVFRAVAAAALAVAVGSYADNSRLFLARKVVPVGEGGDRFRADLRGHYVNAVIENIGRLPPHGTLVVLPEGVMINYLLRRPSSIPYVDMLPSDEAQFGEDELLGALQRRPPELVALVHRTTEEFGLRFFGRDYARRTMAWIEEHYSPVFTVGDPPLQDGSAFGIRVLRRRDEAGGR